MRFHSYITAVLLAAVLPLGARGEGREAYLDLMQYAVQAYTPEHIRAYYEDVDANGIKEHGYARLTANLGILIAHGRMTEYLDTFVHMMDICTRELPGARQRNSKFGEIGNDFAVKGRLYGEHIVSTLEGCQVEDVMRVGLLAAVHSILATAQAQAVAVACAAAGPG